MKYLPAFNFNTTTRMAIRAAIAATLCLLISEYFYLSRSYWAELTALSLITPSVGSSNYQTVMRLIMTIFGCCIGWGLYLLFQNQPFILLIIALLALFITVYTLYHHFVIRMMMAGIIVVMLFSFMGGWNLQLLWIRIYETAIGVAIAFSVNLLVFPEFSNDDVKKDLQHIIQKLQQLESSIPKAHTRKSLHRLRLELDTLENTRVNLEQNYQFFRYEVILNKKKRQLYQNLRSSVNYLCFYFQALLNTKIKALQEPEGIYTYLTPYALDYYQVQIQQELAKLKTYPF